MTGCVRLWIFALLVGLILYDVTEMSTGDGYCVSHGLQSFVACCDSSTGYSSSGSSGLLYCNFGRSFIHSGRQLAHERVSSRRHSMPRSRNEMVHRRALLISDALSMIMVMALSLMKQSWRSYWRSGAADKSPQRAGSTSLTRSKRTS